MKVKERVSSRWKDAKAEGGWPRTKGGCGWGRASSEDGVLLRLRLLAKGSSWSRAKACRNKMRNGIRLRRKETLDFGSYLLNRTLLLLELEHQRDLLAEVAAVVAVGCFDPRRCFRLQTWRKDEKAVWWRG